MPCSTVGSRRRRPTSTLSPPAALPGDGKSSTITDGERLLIFAESGEPAFRALESELVTELETAGSYTALLRGDLDLSVTFDYAHASAPPPPGKTPPGPPITPPPGVVVVVPPLVQTWLSWPPDQDLYGVVPLIALV